MSETTIVRANEAVKQKDQFLVKLVRTWLEDYILKHDFCGPFNEIASKFRGEEGGYDWDKLSLVIDMNIFHGETRKKEEYISNLGMFFCKLMKRMLLERRKIASPLVILPDIESVNQYDYIVINAARLGREQFIKEMQSNFDTREVLRKIYRDLIILQSPQSDVIKQIDDGVILPDEVYIESFGRVLNPAFFYPTNMSRSEIKSVGEERGSIMRANALMRAPVAVAQFVNPLFSNYSLSADERSAQRERNTNIASKISPKQASEAMVDIKKKAKKRK